MHPKEALEGLVRAHSILRTTGTASKDQIRELLCRYLAYVIDRADFAVEAAILERHGLFDGTSFKCPDTSHNPELQAVLDRYADSRDWDWKRRPLLCGDYTDYVARVLDGLTGPSTDRSPSCSVTLWFKRNGVHDSVYIRKEGPERRAAVEQLKNVKMEESRARVAAHGPL